MNLEGLKKIRKNLVLLLWSILTKTDESCLIWWIHVFTPIPQELFVGIRRILNVANIVFSYNFIKFL